MLKRLPVRRREQEAKTWVDKAVNRSCGKNIGEGAAVQRNGEQYFIGINVDVGGYF